jgi:hypothetical protein
MAISLLVNAAKEKGHLRVGLLWFIGIFTSPVVLGLCVIALPDRRVPYNAPLPPQSTTQPPRQ